MSFFLPIQNGNNNSLYFIDLLKIKCVIIYLPHSVSYFYFMLQKHIRYKILK